MKFILPVFTLLLAALALVGGFMLWQRRPGRPVVTVNGRHLSAQELEWRGRTLLNDSKRGENIAVPAEREQQALDYYKREAARLWIYKEIILAAAVARGVTVTQNDEKEAIALAGQKLKQRCGMTLEEYFAEGPMPRELKERDFREGVLVNKFVKIEVEAKIKITGQDIKSRTDELTRRNLMETKPGEKPKYRTDHKYVVALIRSERNIRGLLDLIKSLFPTVQVVSPEYPEFEVLENVMSAKPRRRDAAK